MISGSNLHCIANNFKKILLFTSFMWTLMELICWESKVMVLKSAPDWNIVTKLCKIQLPKRLKKFIRKTNASPAALFTPLPILAPLARNAYCVRFPVPGCWLSTKVGLGPCRPDAGYCLPPSLLLHLLLLLQVPGWHGVPAHHGHPPGLQLGLPGHLHGGVRSAKPCCVEARFTLFCKNYGRE